MKYGICLHPAIAVRKQATSTSEMVTQLLFGETYEVLEAENDWYKVHCLNPDYEGYISSNQHTLVQSSDFIKTVQSNFPYLVAQLNSNPIYLPFGCYLPVEKNFQEALGILIPTQVETINAIDELAKQFLNTPYLWGGRTPAGIDCSGFTQILYRRCGINLPRDAYQQAEYGETISFNEQIECGDLAFFDNQEGKITHVGLMLNKEDIIHASGKVRIDKLDHYGIKNQEKGDYTHKLRIIKRIRS
ncbi:MAG: C40 family peptidase [Bacteroidia bacterium]|jgi:hypothetical protein|nr:C40 family peptidase [Bacteroidia bacterium]